MTVGKCRLTGKVGRLVRAHIIPQALTRPSDIRGEPYIQAGELTAPIRRWTSWYDPGLVTADGEAILAGYDEWGIAELRKRHLVWSSWNGDVLNSDDHTVFENGTHGMRIINDLDGKRLRLFLLSILWRAAASKLPEFEAVRMSSEKLERLRRIVVGENKDLPFLFPCLLMQISTAGPWHNHTPLAGIKKVLREGRKPDKVRFFRFFFDGLAVHFHRDVDARAHKALGYMAVGASDKLGLLTVTYDASFQKQNLEASIFETRLAWPNRWNALVPSR